MMVLVNIEFWGSDEELEKLDKAVKDAVEKTLGVEYLGRFMPEQTRWHYTYFIKAESLTAWDNCLKNFEYKRDRKLLAHDTTEFYI